MHFERTRHYYEASAGYRDKLRSIWADFETEMVKIEQYAGSKGYAKEKAKLEKSRDEEISRLQNEYRVKFDSILKGMRESASTRCMIPPTTEQLNLIQALKLRSKVTRDELQQAGNTLKDNPVCLSILDEIARDNEFIGMHYGAESTASIHEHIDALADSAKRLCSLKKCDSRKELHTSPYDPQHTPGISNLYTFRIDRDTESIRDAMELYGGVSDLASFEAAVNE